MNRLVLLCFLSVFYLHNEATAQTARIPTHVDFITKLITRAMQEVEKLNWSNLKLSDINQNLNERMYNWQVVGNVNYTNGYVVSIENIDVSNMQASVGTSQATIQWILNFRNINVGFDVLVELDDGSRHHFTGTFLYQLGALRISVIKNLATGAIQVQVRFENMTGGLGRMIYLPANNLTEVISRNYVASSAVNSLERWGSEIIQPILVTLVNNEIPFPEICLTC